MPLLDTLNALHTNLKNAVTTLGYNLEDLSLGGIGTETLGQVHADELQFLDAIENSIDEADITFLIIAKAEAKGPDEARIKSYELISELKSILTMENLNTGDLATSKLAVSITEVRFPPFEHEAKTIQQACQFKINFNAEE